MISLCDRSRRPVRYANQLPGQIEQAIVQAKKDKPSWGARKIRELLVRRLAGDVRIPAISTVHAVLDRHGLVKTAKRPRQRALGTALSSGSVPNALWCVDFKGEFRLGNQAYCYPLTVSDCQSARKIDPLSASKIDPTCAVVAGPGRCNFSNEWNRPGSAGGRILRRGS